MDKLLRIMAKVAYTHHPVLISGESGTGKESIARSIHANGPVKEQPFVPVDCGSLVPSLIERELFGCAEGFGPGARHSKTGLLAAADGGTVLLDEIGDLSLELQARLLRTLQDKTVRPIGSMGAVPIRARILASTSRSLEMLVETGRFRKDLFYRLNVVNIRVPALRERSSDVPLLAARFLERCSHDHGVRYQFSDEALRLMLEYTWPGNVRELEDTVQRACALSSGPVVHLVDLPTSLQEHRFQRDAEVTLDAGELGSKVIPMVELERQAILRTLRQLHGDKLQAAKLLGIGKTTLYRKLKEYGIGDEL